MSSLPLVAGAVRRRQLARAAAVAAVCMAVVQGSALSATVAPSDYFYTQNSQWGLDRIKALSAWNESRGQGATVALIDTGVDVDHVDLKGKLLGGIDYVDGGAPNDNQGHGTLMAGIVGALTDNKDANGAGIGVASVAPAAKILPVRWVARDGSGLKGNPKKAAEGIRWATSRAQVIVLGWDWPGAQGSMGTVESVYADSEVQSAIADAAGAGAVVVLAAGNNGAQAPAYNPDIAGVIVAGETTQQDGLASGANAGAEILAPGKDIVSTYWDPVGSFPCPQHAKDCKPEERSYESIYAVGDGTSLGAAHVAGVAALMVSKGGLTNAEIVDKLIASGEKLGSSKLLDAAGALGARIEAPVVNTPTQPVPSSAPIVITNPGAGGSPGSPSPTKSTRSNSKGIKPATTPSKPAASPAPAPGTPTPGNSPSTVTSVVTASEGGGSRSGEPVPLDGTATFLASGLNMVAGAIDYTGGLIKQVGLWQAIAGLGLLVTAFESSRWMVRRRQLRAADESERAGPNDILP